MIDPSTVFRLLVSAFLAAGFSISPLHSEQLSHEPFAGYIQGAQLQSAGNPAVAGYTGDWTGVDFGNAKPVVRAGSLVYPDPAYRGSSDNHVAKDADEGAISAENSGRVFRLLDSSLAVDDFTTGTRYLSWLFKTGDENAAAAPAIYQTLALYDGNTDDANRSFDAGIASGDFATTNYAFRVENSASLRRDLGVAANDEVHLFVAKFDASAADGADRITVWIDPVLGGGEPSGGVTVSGFNIRFDRLALSDYASNSSAWDEIRWGATFDSVTLAPPVPTFLAQPSGHAGAVGDPVALVAEVVGYPVPAFQWERSTDGASGWTPVPEATGQSLELPAAPYAANGFYRLTASNENGSVTSDVMEVALTFPPPEITEQPTPVGTEEGGDATFTVDASGLGNLSYQWRKNGEDLPGETGSTLELNGLDGDDVGAYSVRIEDDAATAESLSPVSVVSDSALLTFGDIGDFHTGLTYRLYDIREPMDRLLPLVPGQTPNVDEKRDTIDWSGSGEFSGYTEEFMVEVIAEFFVPETGTHEFRLTSSDGSELWIGDTLVIDHDGEHAATPMDNSATLTGGLHPLRVRFFLNTGTPELKLEWRPEGESEFAVLPESHLLTPSFVTRVVAPGKKNVIKPGDGTRPGSGAPLASVHPEWEVQTIHPPTFNPKVGALAVHPDGRLFVATFEPNQDNNSGQPTTPNGRIWALTNTDGNDPDAVGVTEVANGLFEPAGMTFVGDTLYVSQRLEVTRLRDTTGDGFYETQETVGSGWESDNYHMFHFGLIERDGFAYSTLSTSIIFSYTGLNGPNPANRGTWVRTNLSTGEVDYLAGGLRTPNGIGFGPEGDIFQTDNQGSWLPASKLNHLREGRFYGHYNNTEDGGEPSLHSDQPVTPPAVYLPQNEVSNSPTQPLLIPEGHDFAGDMLVGELTLGGIRRVSLEKVDGEWQGAVYRFTQGFEAGVNRIEWGPDGSLYVGCIGATGNWSWNGTTRGLQRLSPKPDAPETFEIDRVEAVSDGFRIKFTKPVPAATLNDPANFAVSQWTYDPTEEYGGPKIDQSTLPVSASVASSDRKSVLLDVPGLKAGYVVHLESDVVSDFGEAIWSSEAWYTLNAIPDGSFGIRLDSDAVPENEPAGTALGRLSAEHDIDGEAISFSLPAGQADNRRFSIAGDELLTAVPFDYERRNSWQVRVRATDGSGSSTEADFTIRVTDVADESPPQRILLTNAVLPPDHAAGALVGSLMIDDPDLGDLIDLGPGPGSTADSAIVYEGFDYAAGSALTGRGGGSGFAGVWEVIGGTASVREGSLAHTDADGLALATSGNRGFAAPSSRNHRPLAAARGTEGTATYVSFLADPAPNAHFWGVEFWNGTAGDANRVLQVGNEGGFGVRVRNGTNKFFASSDDAVHFFVVRIDHLAGNDEVSVWIDPPLAADPGAPDLFFSAAETGGSVAFDRIGFSDYVATSNLAVDEFRLAGDRDSVTPSTMTALSSFELVTGDGDDSNALFGIQDNRLLAAEVVSPGLHTLRVRATDSAGNGYEQAVLVWVGAGHLDSNGDGVIDADAVRLGFDPAGADASGAYFGAMGATATLGLSLPLESVLLDASMTPGNLYWVEGSADLNEWFPEPGTLLAPTSFLEIPAGWEIPVTLDPRHFWRVSGGWPRAHGDDPLASGLAGLVFMGGDSTGWTFDSGILKQDVADANPAEWLHFGDPYSDFLLSLEYRVSPNANSGVFLRAAATGNPWETGTEIQITNAPRAAIHSTGAAYDRIEANPAVDATADVWHRMEILMIGHRLRIRVDGVTTIDVADVQATYPDFNWPFEGLVGLQDSHNPSGTAEFRNIRILPLAP